MKLFTCVFLFSCSASAAIGQGHSVALIQTGAYSEAFIRQGGTDATVDLQQIGVGQYASSEQNGRLARLKLNQFGGNGNRYVGHQSGTDNQLDMSQIGTDNLLTISQTGMEGRIVGAGQIGSYNQLQITVSASQVSIQVNQTGFGNTGNFRQQ